MKTQIFRFSRGLWAALSLLFVLAMVVSPLTPAKADVLQKPASQPASIENQDEIGGQGESGSSAPVYLQTSAFLAGRVAVGVIAIESNDSAVPNQENWTADELKQVHAEIRAGLQKWVDWKPSGLPLEFVVDVNGDNIADNASLSDTITDGNKDEFYVEIPYEPIVESSGQYSIWGKLALLAKYPDPVSPPVNETAEDKAYRYAKDLREQNNADWAFVLFVVDSSNDNDGTPGAFFEDDYMRARTFGPIAIMTYNNGTRGPGNMQWATAQLVARMFGAGFQYPDPLFELAGCSSTTKKYGYLGIPNAYCGIPNPGGAEPNPRLMYDGTNAPDSITKQQIGWRDSDGDGIIDPMDTRPSIVFSPYPENPTINNPLTYIEGGTRQYRAYENPLIPTVCLNRPTDECFHSYYQDKTPDNMAVTINAIQTVEFRVDNGTWLAATFGGPADYKTYSFTTPTLAGGKRKIEVRTQNSVGVYSQIKSDTVTVAAPPVNDLFVNRITIPTLAYNHAVNTAAIAQQDEDDPTDPLPLSASCTNTRKGKRSVWYEYIAERNEEIYLDTFGTDYTTVLSVWVDQNQNGVISNDELITCADASSGQHVNLSFTPEAGTKYYFMIGEYNNIAGSMDDGSDVSGQGGGALIFQVSEIKNPAYLPMLFKNAFGGTYNSAFYIQNIHKSIPTKVVIKFYDTNGALTCSISEIIAPLASQGWWLPSMSCLPPGWVGGAYVTSVQPIVAVGRPHVGSEVMTYNGFGAGATETYLPMLFKNAFDGSYKSAFYVQNVDPVGVANISIEFYDQDGVSIYTFTDSIQPLASKGWWLPNLGGLPNGWVGSAVVRSNRNIVAIGRPHAGNEVMTYNGFVSGDTTSYLPMLFKNAFSGGTYKSAFYIQNIDDWNAASVTIKYYNEAGALSCMATETIPPMASRGYWLPNVACLTNGWIGGVEVTSNQPIILVGRPHIDGQITTYNGFTSGATESFVSMLFKNAFSGGSYKSAFYIQNLSPTTTANITIKYYNSAGDLGCSVTDTVPQLASKGYWLPSVGCLLNGWIGGVVITSDQPVVTVGRPHIDAQVTTYAGFSAGSENP